jgi:hypothetical protein
MRKTGDMPGAHTFVSSTKQERISMHGDRYVGIYIVVRYMGCVPGQPLGPFARLSICRDRPLLRLHGTICFHAIRFRHNRRGYENEPCLRAPTIAARAAQTCFSEAVHETDSMDPLGPASRSLYFLARGGAEPAVAAAPACTCPAKLSRPILQLQSIRAEHARTPSRPAHQAGPQSPELPLRIP